MLVDILLVILGIVIGFVIGIIVSRKLMKNYVEEGGVFDEATIKAMMQAMGRTPSKKQVNQVMAQMKNAQKKNK